MTSYWYPIIIQVESDKELDGRQALDLLYHAGCSIPEDPDEPHIPTVIFGPGTMNKRHPEAAIDAAKVFVAQLDAVPRSERDAVRDSHDEQQQEDQDQHDVGQGDGHAE